MDLTMSPKDKGAIWGILAEHCGASARMWPDFEHHFPQCGEFRFQGDLGFGGKVYAEPGRIWVGFYPEEHTPERAETARRANAALRRWFDNDPEGSPWSSR